LLSQEKKDQETSWFS